MNTAPGVGFTKGLSLDLDVKSRHLSLNHAKSVALDLADFTKQQLLGPYSLNRLYF